MATQNARREVVLAETLGPRRRACRRLSFCLLERLLRLEPARLGRRDRGLELGVAPGQRLELGARQPPGRGTGEPGGERAAVPGQLLELAFGLPRRLAQRCQALALLGAALAPAALALVRAIAARAAEQAAAIAVDVAVERPHPPVRNQPQAIG